MGMVLHAIRLVADVIDTVTLGAFEPISLPLDIIDAYTRKVDEPKLRKYKSDKKGNIVFEKEKDYKEEKSA